MTGPPFRRILVANRGEIALRIIRACRELDIEAVAIYSDADIGARHVLAADLARRIGPAPVGESYLRADAIIGAAIETKAEAVHPGYGLLSERADFAQAVEDAGIVFVGPTPATLAALGDKLAARRAAAEVGVPIVPGTFEPLPAESPESMREIARQADHIGWPLLVKAAAGGGGRGMRRVDVPQELPMAVAAASREAAGAFGDGSVYLERLIEGARHIEVQLLGDGEGDIVALGERDCSVQRRHQKLVEEAPAPGLTAAQRGELHGMAVTLARTVGLRSAATAEFLMSADGQVYFLEVNARLQVEHGVTELVTGVDLVQEQFRIAAGQPLSGELKDAARRATKPEAHAIEVRLSAEDPARDFAPVPGTITQWSEPGGPGVRVDSGVEDGTVISAEYDPLMAKLLVVAADRPRALARLRRALDETRIGGLQTTLPFHRWLVDQPDFVAARLRTDLVEMAWDPLPLWREAAERAVGVARHAPGTAMPQGHEGATDNGQVSADEAWDWQAVARREGTERWPVAAERSRPATEGWP